MQALYQWHVAGQNLNEIEAQFRVDNDFNGVDGLYFNEILRGVPGKKSERTVFTMAKFTIPDGKCLVVELNEKNGGRHQSFVIENEDLVRAGTINELQVR